MAEEGNQGDRLVLGPDGLHSGGSRLLQAVNTYSESHSTSHGPDQGTGEYLANHHHNKQKLESPANNSKYGGTHVPQLQTKDRAKSGTGGRSQRATDASRTSGLKHAYSKPALSHRVVVGNPGRLSREQEDPRTNLE